MTPRVNLNESLVSGFFLFRINGTFSMLLIFAPPQSMCLFFLYHICHSNSPLPSKAQNMDSLLIENAKSNRSRCGVCKETIQEGEERVGTQRFHPFKGFPCTTWHHRTCFDCPWHGNQDDVKIVDVSQESFKAFVQAARLVVSPSVQKFRNKSMQEHSFCPITGKSLDASNSHVHHFGPFDFSRIVKSFLRKYRVALHRVSFTAGQFSNESLANSFAAYHERKKRYLMVHQDANLSILKKRKRLGPCDVCFSCRHLTWVFNEGVCKNCRSSPQHRRKYMSARQCRYWYGFTTNNLAGEECQRMTNPISANFAPMRLYKRGTD